MNRKIANATEITVDGVHFQSKLEAKCYTLLKEAGLNFNYEEVTYDLLHSFRPDFDIYEVTKGILSKKTTRDGKNQVIKGITYKPDFVYKDANKIIVIETKGFKNDVYPYKRKIFFKYLNVYKQKYKCEVYFFEPVNVASIKQTIEIIKNIMKNGQK
jgi:IS4 transposase